MIGHGMRRFLLAWLLVLPLVALSTQLAHSIAYRIVEPNALERARHLQETGHPSIQLVPLLAVITFVLAVATGGALAYEQARGRAVARITLWAFAVIPLVGYGLQEIVERLATAHGDLSAIISQPTLAIGLALQIPAAIAAYALARLILRAARQLGSFLASLRPRIPRPQRQAAVGSLVERLVPKRNGGASAAERAPPVALSAS